MNNGKQFVSTLDRLRSVFSRVTHAGSTRWRIQPSVNVPYAIPDPNVVRRVVGYAISIKGGLKVRNPEFVESCGAAVAAAVGRADHCTTVLLYY